MTKKLLLLILASTSLFGQAYRFDPSPATMVSPAYQPGTIAPLLVLPNSKITLCGYPATGGLPCTNLAVAYTDATAGTACGSATPVVPSVGGICSGYTDTSGNFGFWLVAGNYAYVITSNGTNYGPYAISVGGSGGGGGGSPTNGTNGQGLTSDGLGAFGTPITFGNIVTHNLNEVAPPTNGNLGQLLTGNGTGGFSTPLDPTTFNQGSFSVTTYGCKADSGTTIGTDNTSCLNSAVAAASAAHATLIWPPDPTGAGRCYGITAPVVAGNGTTDINLDWRGMRQPFAAGSGNNRWGTCLRQYSIGQDIVDTLTAANSTVSIDGFNFIQGGPFAAPPSGTGTLSGSTFTVLTGLVPSTAYVAGGHGSIYIKGSHAHTSPPCPGDTCTVASVSGATVTITQTCSSSCPTNTSWTVGVGLHNIAPTYQTDGWNLQNIEFHQNGIGFLSDTGTQSSTLFHVTFYDDFIGYLGYKFDNLLEIDHSSYFQSGTYGLVMVADFMQDTNVSAVFESQSRYPIWLSDLTRMFGGGWRNTWIEFPHADIFHIDGGSQLYNWSLTGCNCDSSTTNQNLFVVQGPQGSGSGAAFMRNIRLDSGGFYESTGYLTVAEDLSGTPVDPSSSTDSFFSDFSINQFGTNGTTLRGLLPAVYNPYVINQVNSFAFDPVQFAINTVDSKQPNYCIFGKSASSVGSLNCNVPISSTAPLQFAPSCFHASGDTCTINSTYSIFMSGAAGPNIVGHKAGSAQSTTNQEFWGPSGGGVAFAIGPNGQPETGGSAIRSDVADQVALVAGNFGYAFQNSTFVAQPVCIATELTALNPIRCVPTLSGIINPVYVSGVTITGASGAGTCALTAFNGTPGAGALGTLNFNGSNVITGITMTNIGNAYNVPATTATVGACTASASASGTLVMTSSIGQGFSIIGTGTDTVQYWIIGRF